jgi:hypothetical protein
VDLEMILSVIKRGPPVIMRPQEAFPESSVADPGILCFFNPRIREGKKIWTRIRDEHPRSFFSESLETVFRAKHFLMRIVIQDPESF